MAKARLNKNARAWVRALRSGKYKQTTGVLARLDYTTGEIIGLCCLGVACEVARKSGLNVTAVPDGSSILYNKYRDCLPPAVQNWLGLTTNDGTYDKAKDKDLTVENDINGKSFKQIARIIEQKAKELFV